MRAADQLAPLPPASTEIFRLVDNLVSLSGSEVSEGNEVLKTQAHFYRVLIANCELKAEMAEELAEKFGRDDAS